MRTKPLGRMCSRKRRMNSVAAMVIRCRNCVIGNLRRLRDQISRGNALRGTRRFNIMQIAEASTST
jgi:hypothetical protein